MQFRSWAMGAPLQKRKGIRRSNRPSFYFLVVWMGGKLPPNKCVVGGVVEKSIRAILDKIVIRAGFKSRSELIGRICLAP